MTKSSSTGEFTGIRGIMVWAKEVELNTAELLLVQTGNGFNSFKLAAQKDHLEVLQRIWDLDEEMQMNSSELSNNLLPDKDKYGYMAWHLAAVLGSLKALELLWSWAKEAGLNRY